MNVTFSGITRIRNMPFGNEEIFGYTLDATPKRRSIAAWTAEKKLGLGRNDYTIAENRPDVFILDGKHKSLSPEALLEGLAAGTLKPDRVFTLRSLGSVSMPGGAVPREKPARKRWWERLLGR